MSINQNILDNYKVKWAGLMDNLSELDTSKYTNPFLITFDEDLLSKAELKVMIFGQETKGWGDRFGILTNPEHTVAMYEKFFCQKNFYKGYGKSSFWKAFRFFEKQLGKAYPDKSIYLSWNNINKVGRSRGKTGVSKEARVIERDKFSVIAYEVQAFKPDIVIFLTGPNRDADIKHHFEDASFEAAHSLVTKRAMAQVKSTTLPVRTIRMYHPSYFGGFNKIRGQAVDAIVRLGN
ncbi:hypothetical protein ACMXYR_11385 [Neptuniibacter sp. QD29_5]|uniref:hypothetical protein n=1 Tax=Neptuniibacter sp. QD29_5 TaxID=3398207 RepID=UPI0039F61FCC